MHCFTLIIVTWVSERLNERALVSMSQALWTLPGVVALYAWGSTGTVGGAWGTYAIVEVILSYPYCRKPFQCSTENLVIAWFC
jgi:hypothetical protein